MLRVGADLSILRHPHAGSARWAIGLFRALREDSELEIRGWVGPHRLRRGGLARKVANAVRERAWYDVVIPRLARQTERDVLLMPVNLTARRGSPPQVVSILDVNFLTQPGTYDRQYAAYARRMFARSARDAAEVQTISAFSRTEIATHLGLDAAGITVVYPGLDPPPAPSTEPVRDEPYALYVGASEPHKNLGLLLEAWRQGSPAGLRLAIVGRPGRDFERLREGVAALGDRVRLVGSVSPPELERWYSGARVFVFPSRTEGFGLPPLEAMQRGIPVVAADAASLPEVLGAAARYHAPDDADTLRELIQAAAEDGRVRSAMVEAGHRRAAEFTWARAASGIKDLLQRASRA